jgi:starch-binding outer membrane protein, SusD/RagB family
MKMKNKTTIYLLLVLILTGTLSCKKALEFKPENVLLENEAIQTKEDLLMILNGAYEVTANGMNGQSQNLHELLSDNLEKPIQHDDYTEVYNRNTNFFNGTINGYYKEPYFAINRTNVVMEKVDEVAGVTVDDRQFMVSQAFFLRAFSHFDVVRLFAQPYGYTPDNSHLGVALVLETTQDPLPRSTVQEVYDAIIADLKEAENTLPESNGNYADKYAAKALLAKVYFQMHDYQNAAEYASEVINSGRYPLGGLDRFLTDSISSEAIFLTISTNNSSDNRSGGFTGNYRKDNNPKLVASNTFIQTYFPSGIDNSPDLRAKWFSVINEGQTNQAFTIDKFDKDYFNIPQLHLTEMKLLRAEALAMLEQDLPTAINDVNDIIKRAGLTNTLPIGSAAQEIIARARYERRIEMIGEGNRVDDLKRIGSGGENITIRNAPWDCDGMVLQFPIAENTNVWVMNPEGGCN